MLSLIGLTGSFKGLAYLCKSCALFLAIFRGQRVIIIKEAVERISFGEFPPFAGILRAHYNVHLITVFDDVLTGDAESMTIQLFAEYLCFGHWLENKVNPIEADVGISDNISDSLAAHASDNNVGHTVHRNILQSVGKDQLHLISDTVFLHSTPSRSQWPLLHIGSNNAPALT